MKHLGDFDASTVIYGKFTTYRPSTGAAYTLGGTPALSVYKDNSTTQSTTGVTLTADFDAVTGLNHFAIDTSADGTFYSAGSFFSIVITTGTVDSVSVVGTVVAEFTLRKSSALKPATAGRTLVVDAAGLADANAVKVGPSGSGTAQTARDLGASVLLSSGTDTGQVLLTSGKVDVNDKTGFALSSAGVQAIWDALSSALTTVGSIGKRLVDYLTGDAYARLGAPAGASVSADIASIKTDTGTTIPGRLPAALVGGRMDAYVGAMAANVLDSSALATSAVAEIQTGLSTLDAAGVRTALGLASANLDTQLGALATAAALSSVALSSVASTASAIKLQTDNLPADPADQSAVEAAIAASLTTSLAESYRTAGATGSVAQLLYELVAHAGEAVISGTTKTINKLDHVTPAATFTLDDATNPSSITRAT